MSTNSVFLKKVYLVLALAGAIVPYIYLVQHFTDAGFGIGDFISAVFANPAAGGFTADLLISSFVFWIAMFSRFGRGQGPKPLLFVVLNLTIGLSCALPAYLYANELPGTRS
ncbi:MAG: DUF2834 domain-containing protein [Woeseiaceae bacterium]